MGNIYTEEALRSIEKSVESWIKEHLPKMQVRTVRASDTNCVVTFDGQIVESDGVTLAAEVGDRYSLQVVLNPR